MSDQQNFLYALRQESLLQQNKNQWLLSTHETNWQGMMVVGTLKPTINDDRVNGSGSLPVMLRKKKSPRRLRSRFSRQPQRFAAKRGGFCPNSGWLLKISNCPMLQVSRTRTSGVRDPREEEDLESRFTVRKGWFKMGV